LTSSCHVDPLRPFSLLSPLFLCHPPPLCLCCFGPNPVRFVGVIFSQVSVYLPHPLPGSFSLVGPLTFVPQGITLTFIDPLIQSSFPCTAQFPSVAYYSQFQGEAPSGPRPPVAAPQLVSNTVRGVPCSLFSNVPWFAWSAYEAHSVLSMQAGPIPFKFRSFLVNVSFSPPFFFF